jgi:predicted Zn-dependent protease
MSSPGQDNHSRNTTLRKARREAKQAEEMLAAGNVGPALQKFSRALRYYTLAGVQHTKITARIAELVSDHACYMYCVRYALRVA